MAFENLGDKLTGIFKKLRQKGKLTEKDIKEAMREVKLALLEADGSGQSSRRLHTSTSYAFRYRMCLYWYRSGVICSFCSGVPWRTVAAE